MSLKKIFNSLFNASTNTENINISNNIYSKNVISGNVYINGKPSNSFCVDITNQPLVFKEIECEHFSEFSLSHFKFVFIQNESLSKTKITIEAPQNLIEHISIQDGTIGINQINVTGDSKNLNTNITIEGKSPESIELSCSAILTTLGIKNEKFSIKADTSSSFSSLEVLSNYLRIDCSTSATIEIKHLKPINGNLITKTDCSTSAELNINYLYNSKFNVDLSRSGKITIQHLINSKIKGECSTSAILLVNDLNFVDVETSTGAKVQKV